MRFDLLLPSYKELIGLEKYSSANLTLLELIKAYDMSGDTKVTILDTALEVAEWLKDVQDAVLEEEIVLLNYLQVIKRKRALTSEEEKLLWKLLSSSNISDECKLGAYLLLDQMIPARDLFDSLPIDSQEEFKTFPIYRFYHDT